MIKQNGCPENLLVFQNSLSPAQCLFEYMDRVNWTEWVFGQLTGFQGIASGVTLLEGARGQGMAGCPID